MKGRRVPYVSGVRHSDPQRNRTRIFGPIDGKLEVRMTQRNPGDEGLGVFRDDRKPAFPFCRRIVRQRMGENSLSLGSEKRIKLEREKFWDARGS